METQVEIIPSTDIDRDQLTATLASVESLTLQLAPLKSKARELVLDSPEKYAELGAVLTEVRGLMKQGKAQFAPFDAIVDRVRNFLRTKLLTHQNACVEIEGMCLSKMKTYQIEEKKASAVEEKRENKARAKEGEEPITVKPNIPSVAGYRRTTNFKAEFTSFDALLKEFRSLDARKDKERLVFLRQFIAPNEVALGRYARETKNPDKVQKTVPGVHAWED